MAKFSGFSQTDTVQRRAAVVGDIIDLRLVTANDDPAPSLTGAIAVTTQPSGGTLAFTAGLANSAIALPGYYLLTCTIGSQTTLLEVIAFPLLALSVPALLYMDPVSNAGTRPDADRRNILNSVARATTPAAAQAALEAGAAVSPYYGLTNTLVPNLRLSNFGATQGR